MRRPGVGVRGCGGGGGGGGIRGRSAECWREAEREGQGGKWWGVGGSARGAPNAIVKLSTDPSASGRRSASPSTKERSAPQLRTDAEGCTIDSPLRSLKGRDVLRMGDWHSRRMIYGCAGGVPPEASERYKTEGLVKGDPRRALGALAQNLCVSSPASRDSPNHDARIVRWVQCGA